MQLWEADENIHEQFIFRPGELHVVFWALAALGKYIEGSGIDQAWVEAGLYQLSQRYYKANNSIEQWKHIQ